MKKIVLSVLVILLMVACGSKQEQQKVKEVNSMNNPLPGDSTRYGLACDGCTDSILVLLPYTGEDPDTFDIIEAHQQHRIYGRPHIGDDMAVVVDSAGKAVMLINMERLRGTWCFMATPTLRKREDMTPEMQQRMLQHMPDSILKKWMQPKEYTLKLKRDHTAMYFGGDYQQTSDDKKPVVYPEVKRYTEWHIWNGRLLLKADTIAGFSEEDDVPTIDTVDIQMLFKDSLVLRFHDQVKGFYRQKTNNPIK